MAKQTRPAKAATKKAASKVQPKIIAAVGSAVGGRLERAVNSEDAMVKAAEDAAKKGITDPNVIRRMKVEARAKALGRK